ncbi:MAG: ribosome maturation factor RimM [Erysipelotrichaceae bacterium]|nr:ribosome maturation factor RimM [Erysipelotrichaceae bacterium]
MEVILGIIVGVFGIKGEVKVKSSTDFAKKRYKKGNIVTVYSPFLNIKETLTINNYRKSSNGLDIISFVNKENANDVEKYKGYQILIEKPNEELASDQYYFADLYNCKVYHEDKLIGEIIDMFDGGSHIILRIKRDNQKDLLYPFVDKFIKQVDIENKALYLNPIKGMIE